MREDVAHRGLEGTLARSWFVDSSLTLRMTRRTARSRPQEGLSTPGQGQGEGPDDSKSERSEDEDGVGRGRSERSERSSSCGWTPRRLRPALRLRKRPFDSAQGPEMAIWGRGRPFGSAQGPERTLRGQRNYLKGFILAFADQTVYLHIVYYFGKLISGRHKGPGFGIFIMR